MGTLCFCRLSQIHLPSGLLLHGYLRSLQHSGNPDCLLGVNRLYCIVLHKQQRILSRSLFGKGNSEDFSDFRTNLLSLRPFFCPRTPSDVVRLLRRTLPPDFSSKLTFFACFFLWVDPGLPCTCQLPGRVGQLTLGVQLWPQAQEDCEETGALVVCGAVACPSIGGCNKMTSHLATCQGMQGAQSGTGREADITRNPKTLNLKPRSTNT